MKYENGLEAPVDYEPAHGYAKVLLHYNSKLSQRESEHVIHRQLVGLREGFLKRVKVTGSKVLAGHHGRTHP